MKKLLFYVCLAVLATSCATIFGGAKHKITIDNTRPVTSPVTLTVDNQAYSNVNFPVKVNVKGGFKQSKIIASADGYQNDTVTIDKKFNGKTLLNIFWGGIPGMAIDAGTGAMMKPDSKNYVLNLQPKNYVEMPASPTVIQPVETPQPERVTRDTPGRTSMESTVIRWYFESQPQGARIFWRVISSIPNEVKNTNELWLGNTPFEETRSFNIQGLTYENAGSVQIEIKVRRNGYIDQTKRFNVRQAIDQQEISSFFDMIKVE